MTTYRDLMKVSSGIRQCVKLPGKKFALACVENHKVIKQHMEEFNQKYPDVKGFQEVQTEFNTEISKFAQEEQESKQEFEKQFREKHKDLIEAQNKLEQEKDAALDTEIIGFPGWKKIRSSDLPETITVEQLASIEDIVA